MECDILMFLHSNPECNTAASLVRICKYTKSHVSTSLKRLEQRGLVERQQSATNKKHIELHLTADAQPILADGIAIQKEFAKHALVGISQEEIAVFKSVFDDGLYDGRRHRFACSRHIPGHIYCILLYRSRVCAGVCRHPVFEKSHHLP